MIPTNGVGEADPWTHTTLPGVEHLSLADRGGVPVADTHLEPSWRPDEDIVAAANLTALARSVGCREYEELHAWSDSNRAEFWAAMVERLGIVFEHPPDRVLDVSQGAENAVWFPGARLNIVASCFTGDPAAVALRFSSGEVLGELTYGELRSRVDEIANGLVRLGCGLESRIAIAMPMTIESVFAYLAVIAIGGAVVSIADSFAAEEIATRLRITGADTVITQDIVRRTGKTLPMYAKVVEAGAERIITVDTGGGIDLRSGDLWWRDLLGETSEFTPMVTEAAHRINILFSSGTTGDPKAITWSQLTPIKAATDGHLHQDIHPDDVVAWPTNLGWMMGPWLIFASLLNGATMALHDDAPTAESFVRFVAEAGVTVLGVVPSIVAAWRSQGSLDGADWSQVRVISSTGEASNAEDMGWLMERLGAPVIEYCGGTEIGGGYIAGTVVQPAVAGTFSTPALGIGITLLDEEGNETDNGEVFLIPPSIGLSTELLNRDHAAVYYEGVPDIGLPLRRHGDQMERLPGGHYRAHGRVDDTMNLGGIKVSSAEIERALHDIPGVAETAAIAVAPPGGGPSQLVVYAVPEPGFEDTATWREAMQNAVRSHLNPLFKIHDVIPIDALPRTASAKVMRRSLRSTYTAGQRSGAP